MPDNRQPQAPRIGLIARKSAIALRIRASLERSGLAVAFQATPGDMDAHDAVGPAEVVIIADLGNSRDGTLVRRVRSRFPEARILCCSDRVENALARRAIDLGVDGFIWSNRLEESLEMGISAVQAGYLFVPRETFPEVQPAELTNREKQALSMVIMGLTNLEIAQKLFISENTVKSHLNSAYAKLGVHSRAEAQKLITDPDKGLGTGILAITAPGLARGRPPKNEGSQG